MMAPMNAMCCNGSSAATYPRCSVGYNPDKQRYIGRTLETTKARLIEISVVDGKRPAWFGMSVSAEVVA